MLAIVQYREKVMANPEERDKHWAASGLHP